MVFGQQQQVSETNFVIYLDEAQLKIGQPIEQSFKRKWNDE
jgi:hypothetical protein